MKSSTESLANHFDAKTGLYRELYMIDEPRNIFELEKRERLKVVLSIVSKESPVEDASVLDVGCGAGHLLVELAKLHPRYNCIGIDISKEMVRKANETRDQAGIDGRVSFENSPVGELTNSYDIVTSLGVLGYQADQKQFVEQLADRVKSGSLLILTYGNGDSLTRWTRNRLIALKNWLSKKVVDHDFEDIKLEQLDRVLHAQSFERIHLSYLSFGLGMIHARWAVRILVMLQGLLSNTTVSKYLSLTGIVAYRKI